jgi:benzoylformate decarboxylase
VVTAGQQARAILPFEPFLFAERATEFPQPFVKWACEPARAQDVPAAIARAYHVAMEPPCGPTFVSIPIDDWDQPASRSRRGGSLPRGRAMPMPWPPARQSWTRRAAGAGGGRRGGARWRVGCGDRPGGTAPGPGVGGADGSAVQFPENHPLFAGFLTAGREAIVASLAAHDVVIALGGPMNLYHVDGQGPHITPDTRVWLIGDNPVHAAWAPVGTAIVADTRLALGQLLDRSRPPARRAPPRTRVAVPEQGALTDRLVLQRLAALRPPESVIVEEAPSARGPMHDPCRSWRATRSIPRPAVAWVMACPPPSAWRWPGRATR